MVNLGLKSIPIQLSCGRISVPVCSKGDWDIISRDAGSGAAACLYKGKLSTADSLLLCKAYKAALLQIRDRVGLKVPYYPKKDNANTIKYTVYSSLDKLAADYAGLDIYQIDRLPIFDYWLLLRDAFIQALSKTEDGRKYLDDAWRIEQIEADEEIEL